MELDPKKPKHTSMLAAIGPLEAAMHLLTRKDLEEHCKAIERPFKHLTLHELDMIIHPTLVYEFRRHLVNTLKSILEEKLCR